MNGMEWNGNRFEIVARKTIRLTYEQARAYYATHTNRSYFLPLLDYITSGNMVVLALRRDHAIKVHFSLLSFFLSGNTMGMGMDDNIGMASTMWTSVTVAYPQSTMVFIDSS
jgi:hypothetical protein